MLLCDRQDCEGIADYLEPFRTTPVSAARVRLNSDRVAHGIEKVGFAIEIRKINEQYSSSRSEAMTAQKLHTLIGSGEGSQTEYSIYVENGRVFYETENTSHAFLRRGPQREVEEITLEDLKNHRVRGGHFYEAAKTEVERQLAILRGNPGSE